MKRTPRVLAAVVAATALTFTGVHTADAKPDRAGTHAKAEKAAKAKGGKSAETKIARDVARVQAQLDKATSEKRLEKLDGGHATTVRGNAQADSDALDALLTQTDRKAVRTELRTYRVENYRLVVNVLRKAEKLRVAAAAEEAGVEVAPADILADVAAITATTPKAEAKPALKAARAALAATAELLDPEAGDDDLLEAPEPLEGDGPDESQLDEGGNTGDEGTTEEPATS